MVVAAVAAGVVAAAGLSTVWNNRSNQANFNSQLGQTSFGFSAIFSNATQRLDNCSPALLAAVDASLTYN